MKEIEYTFQPSGVTVHITPVSPILSVDIQRKMPKAPPPPLNRVEYAPGKFREEPNHSDPNYLDSLQEHRRGVSDRINRMYIQLGVRCDVDMEIVRRIRETADMVGVPVEGTDLYVYVAYYLASTIQQWNDLVRLIDGDTLDGEAVEAASESFRPEVQGQTDTPMADPGGPVLVEREIYQDNGGAMGERTGDRVPEKAA